MKFIREKRCTCQNGYTETNIIQVSGSHARKMPRAKKEKLTLPAQKRLNEENSRRAFRLTLNENFVPGDFSTTLTYVEKYLPSDTRAAHGDLIKYLRKLRTIYKKQKKILKYLYVTELGEMHNRIHHHVLINNSGISRDTIEDTWTLGRANTDRLQHDPDGTFNSIADYMMKSIGTAEKHARTWNCSRNIHRPQETVSDNAVSFRQLRALAEAKRNDELKTVAARMYHINIKDIIEAYVGENEITGLVYVKLRYMIRSERKRNTTKCILQSLARSPSGAKGTAKCGGAPARVH